jgi:hypothetical protein
MTVDCHQGCRQVALNCVLAMGDLYPCNLDFNKDVKNVRK